MIEISTNLTELAINERTSTKLALADSYGTDREGRRKLFIISAEENSGTIYIYFTALLEINSIKSHILCSSSDKHIIATAGAVPVIKKRRVDRRKCGIKGYK